MSWRKCGNCGSRWRQLSYYGPLTTQAMRVCDVLYAGSSWHPLHGVRLCPSCIVELT